MRHPDLPSGPDREHVAILRQGAEVWNQWRKENPEVTPNLAHLDIRGSFADLRRVNLIGANLYKAFAQTDLGEADLRKAFLRQANLPSVPLRGAKLTDASLYMARLKRTDLSDATLVGADLRGALLEGTKLTNADISGAKIYGISVWDVKTEGLTQENLVITPPRQPEITVDSIEVAQFIYLLLQNEKLRQVIDTISQKGVLILGRFTKERKAVLDAIRDRLRKLGFVPMMFDFQKPKQRDFTETIKTLAGLSRFIIADITNPKSSPLELQATMPDYMIPFVPIIHEDEEPFSMFRDLKQKYGEWVLDVLEYDSVDGLLEVLEQAVVRPALEKAEQLLYKKTEEIRKRHVKDYKRILSPNSYETPARGEPLGRYGALAKSGHCVEKK
jgi:Pentapeptide repeats (8 copies)